jgi:hypothetical protein
MNEKVPNLDKLKQLCDELNNRDEQLKLNASALWDILEVISAVRVSLSELATKDSIIQKEIQECALKLEEVSCIITEKGCKKVVQDGR